MATAAQVEDAEILDSVAFSLIDNVLRIREISEAEAVFFRAKFRKLYEMVAAVNAQEAGLAKKHQTTTNEILSEKIQLERTRIEEGEGTQQLRRLEEGRNSLQKELEFTEQRDTMAKFELAELRKIHEELTDALTNMRKENHGLVVPVINKLKQEVRRGGGSSSDSNSGASDGISSGMSLEPLLLYPRAFLTRICPFPLTQ